jgi:DNA-binding transcriptional regulator YiaG
MVAKKTKPRRAVGVRRTRSTGRNVGDEIVGGLRGTIAFEHGKATGAAFKAAPIKVVSARNAYAKPAPDYTPEQIVTIRNGLKFSQQVFARVLNVSPETEKAWEQGKAPPTGSAKRLLEIAEKYPEILRAMLVPKV